ncbi:MAG: hypothetical protein WDM76_10290 [Limisphaerales bacterium]
MQNNAHTFAGITFPPAPTPLDGLSVGFDLDMHQAGNAADGVSFNYAPVDFNSLDEIGNQSQGICAQFIVNTYNGAQNWGNFKLLYNGRTLANINQFSSEAGLVRDWNYLPASCRGGVQFSLRVSPDGTLTWQLKIRDYNDSSDQACSTYVFDSGVHVVQLGTNMPAISTNWQAWFGARSGDGHLYAGLDRIDIRGFEYPKLNPVPPAQTAYQDQTSQPITLPLTSADPLWPPANAIVQVVSGNTDLIPQNNISVSSGGNSRQLTFKGGPGKYGNTSLTVLVSYPNSGWTNSYQIPVSILQNIKPTLTLPESVTLQQGRTTTLPWNYGSTYWSLLNGVTVTVSEIPTSGKPLIQNNALIWKADNAEDQPDTTEALMMLTPRLDQTGTNKVRVTVTDGSGDSAQSDMTVTVLPQNDPPVVAGERSALSFNEHGETVQYAENSDGIGALEGNFTIEAWVRPARLVADINFNPVVSFGQADSEQFMILGIQPNGQPSVAVPNGKYFLATNSPAIRPMNGVIWRWWRTEIMFSFTSMVNWPRTRRFQIR